MNTRQIQATNVKVRHATPQLNYSMIALVLLSVFPLHVLAQAAQSRLSTTQAQETAQEQMNQQSALLQIVRQSTERFKDVTVAEKEGYALSFGCVSGPDFGAMGLHFINGAILQGGEVDATRPQIVLYEPAADGSLQLTGADYLVFADAWDKKNQGPPQLMGQIFQYFESPNRFGLPPFYTLHVWAWKDNPNGAFVNWHPKVKCVQFSGQIP
jgi:hypothetical protein